MTALDEARPPDGRWAAEFAAVERAAADADGTEPFNDQARFDAAAGRRRAFAVLGGGGGEREVVGAVILGGGELDLVIAPEHRGSGHGAGALRCIFGGEDADGSTDRILSKEDEDALTAWSHGDHPAAGALATRFGFAAVRRLLRLRAPLERKDGGDGHEAVGGVSVGTFREGTDDAEWVALNARVFASHPEQGAITVDDLHDRRAEEWFVARDFLVARDDAGRMIGYLWLKIEPASDEGEIYVIGVDAAHAGRGLGRRLMRAGLDRLVERGCTSAVLYVEGDNEAALGLYRSLGFEDELVDVQYARR